MIPFINDNIFILLLAILFVSLFLNPTSAIQSLTWNRSKKSDLITAKQCDFSGNTFKTLKINRKNCAQECLDNKDCSHFTWAQHDGGICLLKKGSVSKENAVVSSDPSVHCGIVTGQMIVGRISQQWNVDSNGISWALRCDFTNNDLSNARTNGENCGPTCARTTGCSHFTWTNYNGGTCWMKKGTVTRENAFDSSIPSAVCGILGSVPPIINPGFPGSNFKIGIGYDGIISDSTYMKYDFISIWINTPASNNPSNTDFNPFYQGAMIKKALQLNKTPVFYAYIIAFQARADKGFQDCDVNPWFSLCNKGADYIRQNRAKLVGRYSHQAQQIAQALGDRNKVVLFLMEPDFWQYYAPGGSGGTRQENGPLNGNYISSLFNDFVNAIKSHLPNALISFDISPWASQSEFTTWWGFFRNSRIDFVNTSGGNSRGNLDNIQPNQLTWSFIRQVTGKRIIADCGYGVGGDDSSSCRDNWGDAGNIANRVRQGVIALSCGKAAQNHPPSLSRPNL